MFEPTATVIQDAVGGAAVKIVYETPFSESWAGMAYYYPFRSVTDANAFAAAAPSTRENRTLLIDLAVKYRCDLPRSPYVAYDLDSR